MRVVDVAAGEKIRLFNTLAIETSALCNRGCVFCPVAHGERPDEQMPISMMMKMIDELVALRWRGRISFYIYNEPMRDKRMLDIIRLFRNRLPRVCLMISTNGDYFRGPGDIENVLRAGAAQLLINVYSQQDNSKVTASVQRGISAAARRHTQLMAWIDKLDNIDSQSSVYTYKAPTSRIVRVEGKYGITGSNKMLARYELQNRSGNIPWFQPPLTEPLAKMCVRPFRFLNINWRGEGILCCNDYRGETNFGNIATSSLVEIWNHPALHRYRAHLQEKDRHVPLCATCDYNGGSYPHMIERVTGTVS